jgi:hypothetical protein
MLGIPLHRLNDIYLYQWITLIILYNQFQENKLTSIY